MAMKKNHLIDSTINRQAQPSGNRKTDFGAAPQMQRDEIRCQACGNVEFQIPIGSKGFYSSACSRCGAQVICSWEAREAKQVGPG